MTLGNAPYLVLAEHGLVVRGRSVPDVEEAYGSLGDTLFAARECGVVPYRWEDVYTLEVDDGVELWQYLSPAPGRPGRDIDPDVRRRVASLLDKLPVWDPGGEDHCDPITVAGNEEWPVPSVSFALHRASTGRLTACTTAFREPGAPALAVVDVAGEARSARIPFVAGPSGPCRLLREVVCRERVAEPDFWRLGPAMFPDLEFADGLRFREFVGHYLDVLPVVVELLGVLNDDFLRIWSEYRGQADAVERALGIKVSPESPRTRGSQRLMRHRDVEHGGRTHRCEWHLKIRGDRDRIHFAVPPPGGGRILVGIFTAHLPT